MWDISRILRERNKQRFNELSLESTIYKLYCGVIDAQPYELLTDAFILHDRNLRKEDLALHYLVCSIDSVLSKERK